MTETKETRWWWVRHAPIETVHAGRVNGQLDVGVDLSDGDRIAALAGALPEGATWVTSALSRTQATARALGGKDVSVEPDFNEQHFGDWQGLTWTDISARADATAFWDAPGTTAAPGGESFADQIARVGRAMDRLSNELVGQDVVAVVHAGAIRAALAHGLGLAADRALAFKIDTLSLTRMSHFPAPPAGSRARNWQVTGVNRTF